MAIQPKRGSHLLQSISILLHLISLVSIFTLLFSVKSLSRISTTPGCTETDAKAVSKPIGNALQGTEALALPSVPSRSAFDCQVLQDAERIFQLNQGKRKRFYGTNPLKTVERLHGRYRKASTIESAFLLELYTPDYPCFPEERVGVWSDGGKWVCRLNTLSAASVVYSIGCNGLDDFEVELYKRTKAQVHVWDHTLNPQKKEKVSNRTEYTYHRIGIATETDNKAKLMNLQDMMARTNHTYIDVFKIDCEGCEFEVFPSIFQHFRKPFGQILVEVHAIARRPRMAQFLTLLENNGYRLFHQEMNWRAMNHFELTYIHEDLCRCPT